MRVYRCRWCQRTKLRLAEMAWYERLLSITSVVPYYCPHCFARYYRPHRRIHKLIDNIRTRMVSRFARGPLNLIGHATVIAGCLLIVVGTLASYWRSTSAMLLAVLLGMTSLLPGLGCLALDYLLRRLVQVESQIEQLRQFLEEQRESHVLEYGEAAETSEPTESD